MIRRAHFEDVGDGLWSLKLPVTGLVLGPMSTAKAIAFAEGMAATCALMGDQLELTGALMDMSARPGLEEGQ